MHVGTTDAPEPQPLQPAAHSADGVVQLAVCELRGGVVVRVDHRRLLPVLSRHHLPQLRHLRQHFGVRLGFLATFLSTYGSGRLHVTICTRHEGWCVTAALGT
jgi:hypothetical protein